MTRSTIGLARRHEPNEWRRARRGQPAARPYGRATCTTGPATDERQRAIARDAPGEQPVEVGVALRARRAAEDDCVDRVPGTLRRGDFAPPGGIRVPRLHADEAGKHTEQVVPRVQRNRPVLDRVGALAHDLADDRQSASPPARARRRRARSTRARPRRAHPDARSACASARASPPPSFIQSTNCGTSPREAPAASASAASFALWMSAPSSRSCTLTTCPACSGMLSSPTCAACAVTRTSSSGRRCCSATITVMSFVMLAMGSSFVRVRRREHLPVRRVHDLVRVCVDGRRRCAGRSCEAQRDREDEQPPAHAGGRLLHLEPLADAQRCGAGAAG